MSQRSLAWVLAFAAFAFACGGSTSPIPDSTSSSSSGGESTSGGGGGGGSSSGGASSGASSGAVGCTTEAMLCPDGKTSVGRTGPNCTFAPCPDPKDGGTACGDVAKQCPDGTFVGPTGPKCEYVCPQRTCEQLAKKARDEIDVVLKSNQTCNAPDDCTQVAYATDCFSSCTRPMAKSGLDKLEAAKKDANENECKAFKSQGCSFAIPPCAAPPPPTCVDHKCQ